MPIHRTQIRSFPIIFSIIKHPNTAVSVEIADALHYGADHLPVLAKLVFSSKQPLGVVHSKRTNHGYSLDQNYPNPANPSTTISFTIPKSEHVRLRITEVSGKVVQTLIDEQKQAGGYSCVYDGSKLSSGTYFIELRAGNFHETKKMQFIK